MLEDNWFADLGAGVLLVSQMGFRQNKSNKSNIINRGVVINQHPFRLKRFCFNVIPEQLLFEVAAEPYVESP